MNVRLFSFRLNIIYSCNVYFIALNQLNDQLVNTKIFMNVFFSAM